MNLITWRARTRNAPVTVRMRYQAGDERSGVRTTSHVPERERETKQQRERAKKGASKRENAYSHSPTGTLPIPAFQCSCSRRQLIFHGHSHAHPSSPFPGLAKRSLTGAICNKQWRRACVCYYLPFEQRFETPRQTLSTRYSACVLGLKGRKKVGRETHAKRLEDEDNKWYPDTMARHRERERESAKEKSTNPVQRCIGSDGVCVTKGIVFLLQL